MKTFIRTLNKKFVYAVERFDAFVVNDTSVCALPNVDFNDDFIDLGNYSCEEKALKVLDKLVYWINHTNNYNIGNMKDPDYRTVSPDVPCVFQMPQESEVF